MKYQIKANNKDITQAISRSLLSINITDSDGYKNDTLSISLADDGTLALPEPKATLDVAFGKKEMQSMGRFIVDTVSVGSPVNRITIEAHAANLTKNLAIPRRDTYKNITIGDIVTTVAYRHGLLAVTDKTLEKIKIAHITQTDESDMNFLTRLSRQYGAVFSVKSDRMLFVKDSTPKSSKGEPLSVVEIKNVASWSMTKTAGRAYKSAEARYTDTASGGTKTVMEGADSPTYQLKTTYPNETEAYYAAKSALVAIKKGNIQIELEVDGRTDLHIKQPIKLAGLRQGVDGDYIIIELNHTYDVGQLTTKIKATSKVE